MKNFDFDRLLKDIVTAAIAAFTEISTKHPTEEICAFALYSDSGAMTVCPAMCSKKFLQEKAVSDPEEYLFYKYSPSEWPFEGDGAESLIGDICTTVRNHVLDLEGEDFLIFKDHLMNTCLQAMVLLRRDFFSKQHRDLLLLVTISDDDEPVEELRSRVATLNHPDIATEFLNWSNSWS